MRYTLWQLHLTVCIVYAANIPTARAKLYRECIGKYQTFVASQSSCAKYIYCDKEYSFEGECLDDNYFNEAAGNCDERAAVVCTAVDSTVTTLSESGRNDSRNSSTATPNLQFPPPNSNNNLNVNIFAQNIANTSSNTAGVIQTHPTAVDHPNSAMSLTQVPYCKLVYGANNLLVLPKPDSCSSYYLCYNGAAIPMICSRAMYFNAQSGKCEPQELVECPLLNQLLYRECRKGIYDFMPHPRNCEYYYICSDGYLLIHQCPFQYTWHYELRTCVHRRQSKCYTEASPGSSAVG